MRQFSRVPLVWMVLMVVGSLVLAGCPKQPDIGRPGESPPAGASTAPPPSAGPSGPPAGGEPTVSRPAVPAETPIGAGGAGATGAGLGPGGPGGARASGPGGAGAAGAGAGQPGGAAAISPLKDLYFEYDRYTLPEDQKATLNQNIAWLKANPAVRVTVEGHCDERGTAEYNLGLGERRARTVKEYLVAGGIPADRLATISYGKERPQVLGHDENAWKWNRRAHLAMTAR